MATCPLSCALGRKTLQFRDTESGKNVSNCKMILKGFKGLSLKKIKVKKNRDDVGTTHQTLEVEYFFLGNG